MGQVPPGMLEHQLACKNEGLCSWEQRSRAVFAALTPTVSPGQIQCLVRMHSTKEATKQATFYQEPVTSSTP